MTVVIIRWVTPEKRDRLVGQGAALPGGAVALVHAGGGILGAKGEQLAAPGFAIKQPAQEAGDFAFAGARVKKTPACSRWERDKPGSRSFCHVRRVWVIPAFFNAC